MRLLESILFEMANFNLDFSRLTFLLYFFVQIFWSFTHAACYFPNGVDMKESTFQPAPDYSPCNTGGEHAMCCARWDTCRFDGLCFTSFGSKEVFRDGCTDRTWKSPSCVKLCIDGICKQKSSSKSNSREVGTILRLTKCFKCTTTQRL